MQLESNVPNDQLSKIQSQPVLSSTTEFSFPNTQSTTSQPQKVQRAAKKRRNDSSMDDEVAQAIINSLNCDSSSTLTPLGQIVSNLENKLDEKGFQRQKLAFIRKINSVVMETEEEILDM